MRIRKRAVSSSDPATILLCRSLSASLSTVQFPASDDTAAVNHHAQLLDLNLLGPHLHDGGSQPPQQCRPVEIHGGGEELSFSAGRGEMEKMMRSIFEDGEDDRKEMEICDNHRYLSLSSFEVGSNSDYELIPPQPQSSSSSIQVVTEEKSDVILTPPAGRWLDGDKNMPLKKRKASFEMIMNEVDETKNMTMMSKTNNKSSILSNNGNSTNVVTVKQGVEAAADDDDKVTVLNKAKNTNIEIVNTTACKRSDNIHKKMKKSKLGSSSNKKTSKGKKGILMQGSRCSRVNGRGWRCSQPTLVGYSLCEHHLGKGRLIRSISCCTINDNIKRRSISPSSIIDPPPLSSPESIKKKQLKRNDDAFDRDGEEENEHTRMSVISNELNNSQNKKRRVKLGRMVKARSLSSLLGQLNAMVHLPPTANGICK